MIQVASNIQYLRLPHTTKRRLIAFLSSITFRRLYRCANCKYVYVHISLHGRRAMATDNQESLFPNLVYDPPPHHILSTEKFLRIIFVGYLEFIDNIFFPILCKQAKPHAKWLNENFISNFIHVSVRSEYCVAVVMVTQHCVSTWQHTTSHPIELPNLCVVVVVLVVISMLLFYLARKPIFFSLLCFWFLPLDFLRLKNLLFFAFFWFFLRKCVCLVLHLHWVLWYLILCHPSSEIAHNFDRSYFSIHWSVNK